MPNVLQLGPFMLHCNRARGETSVKELSFTLDSPTTQVNALRVFRALQLNKPILLEGSPGQGKTALVTALAKAAGFPLTRINLSEQTDISDLFGTDLPVEGEQGGHFAWRDGPLLQALKEQSWILLDELNLASQSALEGLNACLDHRGEIFVPELNKTFKIHESGSNPSCTRIFACQNPLRQGGARKGLPKSFLNRFTQVYVDALAGEDMEFILRNQWPLLSPALVKVMTSFAMSLHQAVCVRLEFGTRGAPWDFNLRDLMRWAEIAHEDYHKMNGSSSKRLHPELFVDLIYGMRMRSPDDRRRVLALFNGIWCGLERQRESTGMSMLEWGQSDIQILPDRFACGRASIPRSGGTEDFHVDDTELIVLRKDLASLEGLTTCLNVGWMPILVTFMIFININYVAVAIFYITARLNGLPEFLFRLIKVGASGTGKTSLVKLLAKIIGKRLEIINPSPEMDTIELLGGFEQVRYIFVRIFALNRVVCTQCKIP